MPTQNNADAGAKTEFKYDKHYALKKLLIRGGKITYKEAKYGKLTYTELVQKTVGLIGYGCIHITINNTIVTITDLKGNTLGWTSAGVGLVKGARRATSYSGYGAGKRAGKIAYGKGLRAMIIKLNGRGSGRNSSMRGLRAAGLLIIKIKDYTSLPHNGCKKSRKKR